MPGSLVLDTNIVIGLFAREDAVLDLLRGAPTVTIPSIVLGELYFGAHKSGRQADNFKRVVEFADASTILVCDTATAQFYGETKNRLRLKGRPLPENDIWIAALVRQHDGVLVTRDAHFSEIEGLALHNLV